MTVEIDGRPVGLEERPYVVVEVGINARTDVELAKSFIDAAAEAGADAVKFQTHMPDEEMVRSEMERLDAGEVYEAVADATLSAADHRRLQAHCESVDVTFLSTPFSAAGVDLLDDLGVPAIKIGSGELTNHEILARAADVGVPLIVSTGMSERSEIRDTVAFLRDRDVEFVLLYCVSAYPADPELFNLDLIPELREEFDVPVGLSDHSLGVGVAPLAMARGAAVVEKHFTLDRRLPGPDQSVSIEPDELEELVEYSHMAAATSGDEKPIYQEEAEIREWAGHSVVTTRTIAAGDRIEESDLTTKRPGTGVPANRFFEVVGRTAVRDLEPNTVLSEDDLS